MMGFDTPSATQPPIEKQQIARIKMLQKELGMNDEEYRGMLKQSYNKTSCTDLSHAQAYELIGSLSLSLSRRRIMSEVEAARNRPGMATNRQLWKIRDLWSKVSRTPEGKDREIALTHFLRNRFHVQGLTWLEGKNAHKVICTLEVMERQGVEEKVAEVAV